MKNNYSLVSIVIPVYNRISLVSKSIESVLNQTYENIEIIIIDNKSNDGTYEFLIEKYKHINKVFLYQNSKNVGPVRNWIRGLELSKGIYVKLLFSDDWIDKDYLEKSISLFNDSIGLVYTPTLIHRANGKIVHFYFKGNKQRIFSSKNFIINLLIGNKTPVSPGCAIFRRDDLIKSLSTKIDNYRYEEYMKYGAGLDLFCFLSIANQYKYTGYVGNTFSHFLQHKNSFTSLTSLRKYYKQAKFYFIMKDNSVVFRWLFKFLICCDIDRVIAFISNRV